MKDKKLKPKHLEAFGVRFSDCDQFYVWRPHEKFGSEFSDVELHIQDVGNGLETFADLAWAIYKTAQTELIAEMNKKVLQKHKNYSKTKHLIINEDEFFKP